MNNKIEYYKKMIRIQYYKVEVFCNCILNKYFHEPIKYYLSYGFFYIAVKLDYTPQFKALNRDKFKFYIRRNPNPDTKLIIRIFIYEFLILN